MAGDARGVGLRGAHHDVGAHGDLGVALLEGDDELRGVQRCAQELGIGKIRGIDTGDEQGAARAARTVLRSVVTAVQPSAFATRKLKSISSPDCPKPILWM